MGLCFHLLINKGYPSWNGFIRLTMTLVWVQLRDSLPRRGHPRYYLVWQWDEFRWCEQRPKAVCILVAKRWFPRKKLRQKTYRVENLTSQPAPTFRRFLEANGEAMQRSPVPCLEWSKAYRSAFSYNPLLYRATAWILAPLTPNSNDPTDIGSPNSSSFPIGPAEYLLFLTCQTRRSTKITGKCFVWHRRIWTMAQVKMVERIPSGAQYPPEMVQRTSPIKSKNDLVWIVDHREKRGFYRLVRVKKCRFGSDGNIRPCDILTQSGSCFLDPTVKFSRGAWRHWGVFRPQ